MMARQFETEDDYYVWARQLTERPAPLETKALEPTPLLRSNKVPPTPRRPATTWLKAQLQQRDAKITAIEIRLKALEGRKL